jgi:nitrogenase molybdenum-iron protein alpha/beta subunit
MLAREVRIPTNFKGVSKECIEFINKVQYPVMQMIQRHAKKRLGYNGINEILEHPWLKMDRAEQIDFRKKKTTSPITPLQINYHQSLQ